MQLNRAMSDQTSGFDRSRSIALWQSELASLSSSREASEPLTQTTRARDNGPRDSVTDELAREAEAIGEEVPFFHGCQRANNRTSAKAIMGRTHFPAFGSLRGLPDSNEAGSGKWDEEISDNAKARSRAD
jgi:hypothetical protein